MTALAQWRSRSRQSALGAGVDPAEVDWLIKATTGVWGKPQALSELELLAQLEPLWQRRLSERCPVQYLLGKAYWREYELVVSPAVLIPRPETELMVEIVAATGLTTGLWADLGTGSGALALGLSEVVPQVIAVDLSEAAIAIAKTNSERYQKQAQIELRQGSWFQPLVGCRLQGMVSNPPYIPTAVWATLEPEVHEHEPRLALDGGKDGLLAIATLMAQAPDYIVSGGFWLVEVMQGQAVVVAERLAADGRYDQIEIHRDLAGIERFVAARVG